MNKRKSLFVNTLYQGISNFTNLFLFILLILAGRYLGTEGYGKFSFAFAYIEIFAPIIEPGLSPIIVREISRDKTSTQKYLYNVLSYKIGVSFLYCLLPLSLLLFLGTSKETLSAVSILAFARILKTFKGVFVSAEEAYEYFGFNALSAFIERFLILAIGASILVQGGSILNLCWVFVAVRMFDLIINVVFVRFYICKLGIVFEFQFLKDLLKEALPIGIFSIILVLYTYIDTVMISFFRGDVETGLYNAAFRIYEGLVIIPGAAGVAFMPRLSQSFKYDKSYFEELVKKGLKYITIISFPILVCGFVLSGNLMIIFFGHDYISSVLALKILLCGILFMFLMNFSNMVLVSMDKQKIMLYIAIVGLVLNVLLNLILIPHKGFVGAAIATLIGECSVFTLLSVYLYEYQKINIFRILIKPLVAMSASILMLHTIISIPSIYLEVVVWNVVYIILLIIFKTFDKREIETVFSLIKFKKKIKSDSSMAMHNSPPSDKKKCDSLQH